MRRFRIPLYIIAGLLFLFSGIMASILLGDNIDKTTRITYVDAGLLVIFSLAIWAVELEFGKDLGLLSTVLISMYMGSQSVSIFLKMVMTNIIVAIIVLVSAICYLIVLWRSTREFFIILEERKSGVVGR